MSLSGLAGGTPDEVAEVAWCERCRRGCSMWWCDVAGHGFFHGEISSSLVPGRQEGLSRKSSEENMFGWRVGASIYLSARLPARATLPSSRPCVRNVLAVVS